MTYALCRVTLCTCRGAHSHQQSDETLVAAPHALSHRAMHLVRTGSWTSPPREERAPRVRIGQLYSYSWSPLAPRREKVFRVRALPRHALHLSGDKGQLTPIGHIPGGGQPRLREGGRISYEARTSGLFEPGPVCTCRGANSPQVDRARNRAIS